MLTVTLYGQNSLPPLHYYYIEGSVTDALKPSNLNTLSNGELQFTFKDHNLENFFVNEDVYVCEKAKYGAINSRLQNMYCIAITRDNEVNSLKSSSNIVYSDCVLQNLTKGTYLVNLIANGSIIDAKQLIIN